MRNGWKLQKVAIFRRSKALLQDDDLPSVVFTLKLPLHAHKTAACFGGVSEYVGLIQQQHDTRILCRLGHPVTCTIRQNNNKKKVDKPWCRHKLYPRIGIPRKLI